MSTHGDVHFLDVSLTRERLEIGGVGHCRAMGIHNAKTAVYTPHSNGAAERTNPDNGASAENVLQ